MLIPDDTYRKIQRSMPIPCVDLMILNAARHVLLVKRANKPARGQWWFPGGRVHFLENRHAAALRKLLEECNLQADSVTELRSFDLIFPATDQEPALHSITTLYLMRASDPANLKLDAQSIVAEWRSPGDWQSENLHSFVADALRDVAAAA